MKNFKFILTSVAVAALVAACGGGDDPVDTRIKFAQVVTFGAALAMAVLTRSVTSPHSAVASSL